MQSSAPDSDRFHCTTHACSQDALERMLSSSSVEGLNTNNSWAYLIAMFHDFARSSVFLVLILAISGIHKYILQWL